MKRCQRVKLTAWVVLLATSGCGGTTTQTGPESGQTTLAPTPEVRASMEIASARELERLRKTKQALDAYHRIAKDYPDSPQAKTASERIKALGGR
ncbi:MAG: hypothetical protein P4L84_10980 [Isosphaeraceae bacterium]|nr:hypothetical protein [Isosphaeraceae bacterium]